MTTNSHLSDNEFAELLGGNASQTVLAHLQICEECSVEAKELRETVAGLREGLGAVAAQSRIQHVPAEAGARRFQPLHARSLRMAGALAVLLMVAGGILLDRHSPESNVETKSVQVQQLSESDLLNQVQAELTNDVPAALQPANYIAEERQQILQSAQQRGDQGR
jgi:anti-sigma factor RsiW